MILRFTRPAARQLERVLASVEQHSPQGAREVQQRIQAVLSLLSAHPRIGARTTRAGIRRFIVSRYPYAITYPPTDDAVIILGIRHTARKPVV